MHALVQVLFLDVHVPVEVHDADLLRRGLRDAAHAWEADGVIAAEHHRQGPDENTCATPRLI